MKTFEANVLLEFDAKDGWRLPPHGSRPDVYWAWLRFREESPEERGMIWTAFVEVPSGQITDRGRLDAILSYMSPDAPRVHMKSGAEFQLYMGEVTYAVGRVL